ncbi:hypothetical protein [Streptomyces sp. NPDC001843]|uniref:hypothetical protein n=1 Tax=Streptomyces sp. NPDC001843 TaxID=3364617 RepID=UPI0036A5B76D
MTATDSLSIWLRVRHEADWQSAPALQRVPRPRWVLDFALPAGWQREFLAATRAPFRVSDAYAKAGRERYGLTPHAQADLDSCLRETTDPDITLAARAAAYTSTWRSFTPSPMAMPAPR